LRSVSTSIGTKKGRIYIKGALFTSAPHRIVGGRCPKLLPPGSAIAKDVAGFKNHFTLQLVTVMYLCAK